MPDFFSELNTSPCNLDDITTKRGLLKHINAAFSHPKSVIHLQGIFQMCETKNLYKICKKYAKSRNNEKIMFYERAGKKTVYSMCNFFHVS